MPKPWSSAAARRHLPLTAVLAAFTLSRLAAYAAGVRFDDTQLHYAIQNVDPDLLRHRLAESLFYLHSQPPLWNLLLGVVLKLFPGHVEGSFFALFLVLGLVHAAALLRLLERLGVGAVLRVALTIAVVVAPATLVYENWLFYDYPVLVALTVAALAFHAYLERPTFVRGLALFSLLAAVVLTRSVFQHVWLLLVIGLLVLWRPASWRKVLVGTALPLAVVAAVYVKNAAVFGVPSTSSWLGMNLARITVAQLPEDERRLLVDEGKLSRVSLVQPFFPLGAYERAGALPKTKHWGVAALDRPARENGEHNANAAAYIEISRHYLHDALWVIGNRPGAYAHGLKRALEDFLQPPTRLPLLAENRGEIAAWDRFYERFVYVSLPQTNLAGVLTGLAYLAAGLYGLLLAIRLVRRRPLSAADATLLFVWLTMVYVALVGTLTDVGENVRFRLLIDPIVVALVGVAALRAYGRLKGRLRFPRRHAEALE